MKHVIFLALSSLWHRRVPTALTMVSIAMSVALYVGVDKTRNATREAFSGAISKVDLIVGPRAGSIGVLLYSVFHVGSPTHVVSMKAVSYARSLPQVDWVVPFSLGDGYRGFPVVGTEQQFFSHYKVRDGKSPSFSLGGVFRGSSDVVIGADVAREGRLKLGDKIVLSHGHTEDGDGFERHEEHPFTVSGVLAVSGSPLDRSLFVSLDGLGEIHRNLIESGDDHDKKETAGDHDHHHEHEHEHGSFDDKDGQLITTAVSGFFLGTKERSQALALQRTLNTWDGDALLAIMPGMAMAELWKNLSIFETALLIISMAVVLSGILGLFVSLFIVSGQRRREMMVLRAVGAGPVTILGLLAGESMVLVFFGILLGWSIMFGGFLLLGPWLEHRFSVALDFSVVTSGDFMFATGLLLTGCVVGVIASIRAYRVAMQDGLGTRF
jgi:putative ABC transport system permease protein